MGGHALTMSQYATPRGNQNGERISMSSVDSIRVENDLVIVKGVCGLIYNMPIKQWIALKRKVDAKIRGAKK